MRKMGKRVLSLFLALLMMLGTCDQALAAGANTRYTESEPDAVVETIADDVAAPETAAAEEAEEHAEAPAEEPGE